ncbi:STAS domain-containing protein [Leptothoe sp. ISB3NOV94-8A]
MQNTQPDIKVIQPNDILDASNADALWNILSKEISSHKSTDLMIDMSNVKSLDSIGLIPFVSAVYAARGFSKNLYLYSVSPKVRMIFELTQLDRLFKFVEKEPVLLM